MIPAASSNFLKDKNLAAFFKIPSTFDYSLTVIFLVNLDFDLDLFDFFAFLKCVKDAYSVKIKNYMAKRTSKINFIIFYYYFVL